MASVKELELRAACAGGKSAEKRTIHLLAPCSPLQQQWPSCVRAPGRLCCATLGKPSPSLVTSEGGRQEPGQRGGGPAGRGMRWAAEGDADSGDGAVAAAGGAEVFAQLQVLSGDFPLFNKSP